MCITALSLPQEGSNQLPCASYLPGLCESHDIYSAFQHLERDLPEDTVKEHTILYYALQNPG